MLQIKDILVARNGSPISDPTLRHGFELAARSGARLHVLNTEVFHDRQHDRKGPSEDRASPTEGIDQLREKMKEVGTLPAQTIDEVSITGAVRRDVSPVPAILSYAAEKDVDVIAIGIHWRGPSGTLIGNVADGIVRRAERPVLTLKGEGDPSPAFTDRILVPVDFSDASQEALQYANGWASLFSGGIDVLHVIEETLHPASYVGGIWSIYDAEPNIEAKVRARLKEFVEEREGLDHELHVMHGRAPSAIARFIEEKDIDLVCMSTHSRTGMERFFLGSVSEKVVRLASSPVLTLKSLGALNVSSALVSSSSSA